MADNLNGKWKCTAALLGGGDFQYKNLTVEVKNGSYYSTVNNQKESGLVQINETTTPKQMDISIKEGPNQGKTMLAIYDLKGKELTVCYNIVGSTRPAEFASTNKNGFLLLKFSKITGLLSYFGL